MAETSIAQIEDRLRFASESDRYEIFLELYLSEDQNSKDLLKKILTESDPLIKILLLHYLEEIPEKRAVFWILPTLNDSNDVVRQAAKTSYEKNQYARKFRLLRPFVLDSNQDAARFAIRNLSLNNDREIVPALIEVLGKAEPPIKLEIIKALRLLPDPRSVPHLIPYLNHKEDDFRYHTLRSLSRIAEEHNNVPAGFFLKFTKAPEYRIRRTALAALRFFPSRKISQFFLNMALTEETIQNRQSAIQALASFPDPKFVLPLVTIIVNEATTPLRLTAEVALKRFPKKILKVTLISHLNHEDRQIRHRCATLLAEIMGSDPDVSPLLLKLWTDAKNDGERLNLMDVLRELEPHVVIPILFDSIRKSQLLAYAATGIFNRFWTPQTCREIMTILNDRSLAQYIKQSLLDALVKWGPEPNIHDELFVWCTASLKDKNINIRYLSTQVLVWYPTEKTLPYFMEMLVVEDVKDITEEIVKQLSKGLNRNPTPLFKEFLKTKEKTKVLPYILEILKRGVWDERYVTDILVSLASDPVFLNKKDPEAFIRVGIQWIKDNLINFELIWPLLPTPPIRAQFLEHVHTALEKTAEGLPALPLSILREFLEETQDLKIRRLLYSLIHLNGEADGVPLLTECVLKETDPEQIKHGKAMLKSLIWGSVS